MNRRWLVIALAAALGASCGDPTTDTGVLLNLDRPVDIAFACYGSLRITEGRPTASLADPIEVMAQPTTSCDTWSLPPVKGADGKEVPQRPMGQEDLDGAPVAGVDWYGFILQSASGTVAVAQWPSQPAASFVAGGSRVTVLDADPLTPGKNAISVGEEPIAIATDKAGCFEVTANAGSCDLSTLDITSALDNLTFTSGKPATSVIVNRLDVKDAAGKPIRARPAAMVMEPNTTVVGNRCGATASGLAYVAYPSCHLVAAVDTATGTIVSRIQYDASGTPQVLPDGNAMCPAECPDASGKLDAISDGVRPVTLALEFDPRVNTRRLVIGADNKPAITLVELGADFLPQTSQMPSQIALQNPRPSDKLGVTSIALSPQIGMGGSSGDNNDASSPGGQGQFVYAVATDHTVRVVDIFTDATHALTECDTQVDTRFVRSINDVTRLQCFPVGDPATPPRRSGARGPGIELPGDGVPTSVAFVKAPGPQASVGPLALVGYFAIITASSGQAFVVNVDDDNNPTADVFQVDAPQSTAPVLLMAHQLRDDVVGRDAVPSVTVPDPTDPTGKKTVTTDVCKPFFVDGNLTGGGPHATTLPVNTVPVPDVVAGSAAQPVSTAKLGELPNLRQVKCTSASADLGGDAPAGVPVSELQITANPMEVRDPVFPDLRNLFSDETWSLTWEGSLSQDSNLAAVDGPPIRAGQMFVDTTAGGRIDDGTRPFCAMGVEPFDILQMRGCNPLLGDSDCPSGYQCFVHPESRVTVGSAPVGACMLRTEATRLADACRDFLISLRRYTIQSAASGELQLIPRKHVLRTTPLDGCTDDAQCAVLADYAAQNAKAGADPTTAANRSSWVCRADDARAPVNADPTKNKRCIQTCAFHSKDTDGKDRDVDCDAGSICQGAGPSAAGVCMEGVMPPQACVNGPQRFEVRASEAFTVIGSQSGYVHPIIETPPTAGMVHGGACTRDLAASPLQKGRIGLDLLKAPACDPAADPITGAIAGGFDNNPCSLTVQQTELQRSSSACDAAKDTLIQRDNTPAIKFRNRGMTLTLVDPYYPGDATCAVDRHGTLDRVPLVFPGYRLSFHQVGGYTPLTLSAASSLANPVFPVKVVTGPTNSIWVLDDGDNLLVPSLGLPATRGQVFRVESSSLSTVNLLQ
jgi:hypothetical protein